MRSLCARAAGASWPYTLARAPSSRRWPTRPGRMDFVLAQHQRDDDLSPPANAPPPVTYCTRRPRLFWLFSALKDCTSAARILGTSPSDGSPPRAPLRPRSLCTSRVALVSQLQRLQRRRAMERHSSQPAVSASLLHARSIYSSLLIVDPKLPISALAPVSKAPRSLRSPRFTFSTVMASSIRPCNSNTIRGGTLCVLDASHHMSISTSNLNELLSHLHQNFPIHARLSTLLSPHFASSCATSNTTTVGSVYCGLRARFPHHSPALTATLEAK